MIPSQPKSYRTAIPRTGSDGLAIELACAVTGNSLAAYLAYLQPSTLAPGSPPRPADLLRRVPPVEAIRQMGDNGPMDEQIASNRWAGVNRYVAALYGRPIECTDLLLGLGFSRPSLAALSAEHQLAFADQVVEGIRSQYLTAPNGVRLFDLVTHLYGLDGDVPWPVLKIAETLQITPTRVRQLRTRALRRYKTPAEIARLEQILRTAADNCLGGA